MILRWPDSPTRVGLRFAQNSAPMVSASLPVPMTIRRAFGICTPDRRSHLLSSMSITYCALILVLMSDVSSQGHGITQLEDGTQIQVPRWRNPFHTHPPCAQCNSVPAECIC